jgi:hypothetical protein
MYLQDYKYNSIQSLVVKWHITVNNAYNTIKTMEKVVDKQACFSVVMSQGQTKLYAYTSFLVYCLKVFLIAFH